MSVAEAVLTDQELNEILITHFNNEWSGQKRDIPYSEVLKKRGAIYNIMDGFIMPNNGKGDNLQLASLGIVQFIDYINDHIEITNSNFRDLTTKIERQRENPLTDISIPMYRVRVDSEILAYLLKTVIDKIIVMMGYAFNEEGVDSIGGLLKDNRIEQFCKGSLSSHSKFLDEINGLNNGYKHTFSNLQLISVTPQIEPVMFAMYKMNNSTTQPTKIYHMISSNAVDEFNDFIKTVKSYTVRKVGK